MHQCLVFIVLTSFVCVFGKQSEKIYCKDPDTGTLHPQNSTWSSKSFCGKYYCKIQKKINNSEEHLQVINDLSIDKNKSKPGHNSKLDVNKTVESNAEVNKNATNQTTTTTESAKQYAEIHKQENSTNFEDMKQSSSDKTLFVQKELSLSLKPFHALSSAEKQDIEKSLTNTNGNANLRDKGRYVNDDDIDKLSKMLHTLNKNELETVAEVYQLAKQIFNVEEINLERFPMMEDITQKVNQNKRTRLNFGSHFYEPMLDKGSMDLKDVAEVAAIPATTMPLQKLNIPYQYIDAVLKHLQQTQGNQSNMLHMGNLHHVLANKIVNRPVSYEKNSNIEQKVYMPYPFSNIIRGEVEPINGLKLQREPMNSFKYPQMPHVVKSPNSSQSETKNENMNKINSDAKSILDCDQVDNVVTPKSNVVKKLLLRKYANTVRIPWQMRDFNSLMQNNVQPNAYKPDKTSVKTNWQRIGKIIKLDNLVRQKRNDVKLSEEYESYIDKITCPFSLEPGYYRLGNSSLPYPECCPQKIELRKHNETTTTKEIYYDVTKPNKTENVTVQPQENKKSNNTKKTGKKHKKVNTKL